jgi:hypothetical protein
VLTSTITRSPSEWAIAKSYPNGVADMALSEISVPALVMSHRNDVCPANTGNRCGVVEETPDEGSQSRNCNS